MEHSILLESIQAITLPGDCKLTISYGKEVTVELLYRNESIAYGHSTNFIRFRYLRSGVQCSSTADMITKMINYAWEIIG